MRNEAHALPEEADDMPESGNRAKSVEELNRMMAENEAERAAARLEDEREVSESHEKTGGDRFESDVQRYNELDKQVADANLRLKKIVEGIPPSANREEAQASAKADIEKLKTKRDNVMNAYGTDAGVFKHDVEQLNKLRTAIESRKKDVRRLNEKGSKNPAMERTHGMLFDRLATDIVKLERTYDTYVGNLKADYDSRDKDNRAVSHDNLSSKEIDAALAELDDLIREDEATIGEITPSIEVTDAMLAEGDAIDKARDEKFEEDMGMLDAPETIPAEDITTIAPPAKEVRRDYAKEAADAIFKAKVGETRYDNLSKKAEAIADTLRMQHGVTDIDAAMLKRSAKSGVSRFFGGLFSKKESLLAEYQKLSEEMGNLKSAENEEANRMEGDARYQQAKGMGGRSGSRLGSGEGRGVERK